MEISFVKFPQTFLIVVSLCFSCIRSTSYNETTFRKLCRFDGMCLNCSEGGCVDMCEFYDNYCCINKSSSNTFLQKWQYSCVRLFPDMYDLHLDCRASQNGVYGVYMVAKCSDRWRDVLLKTKCESDAELGLLSRIPVYDSNNEQLTFKNLFCALCNWQSLERIRFWKFDLMCNNDIGTNGIDSETDYVQEECFVRLIYRQHRMCAVDVIESCAEKEHNASVRNLCEDGLPQTVFAWKYGHVFSAYKNEFCAQCNGETDKLQCWAFQAFSCWPQDLPPYRSVKAMIHVNLNGHNSKTSISLFNNACGKNVLFDPFSKTCLNVTCLPSQDICIHGECRLVRPEVAEISFQNDSSLYFATLGIFIKESRYFEEGKNIIICLDENQYTKFKLISQSTPVSAVETTSSRPAGSSLSSGAKNLTFTSGCINTEQRLRLFVLTLYFVVLKFS